MKKRPGVTIMEVLGASFIIVIALVGVGMAMTQAAKKSGTPHKVEQAVMLAAERLSYFRTQPDPFRAVGGTHYMFTTNTTTPDFNTVLGANNNYNGRPQLFVREYLYGSAEGVNINRATGVDEGRVNQRDRALGMGGGAALNQIPATPPRVDLVFRTRDNSGTAAPVGVPAALTANAAPRANALLPGAVGAQIPASIQFVREVWSQTNHPLFTVDAPAETTNLVVPPDRAANLPPYTVAVTVKVFARDPQTRTFNPNPPAGNPAFRRGVEGPGYDPSKPLAVVTGYFGLRREMN